MHTLVAAALVAVAAVLNAWFTLDPTLRAWKERTRPAGEPAGSSLDAGTLEQLRKLGYLR